MKAKIVRALAEWINRKYPYLLREIVVGHDYYTAHKPRRQPRNA